LPDTEFVRHGSSPTKSGVVRLGFVGQLPCRCDDRQPAFHICRAGGLSDFDPLPTFPESELYFIGTYRISGVGILIVFLGTGEYAVPVQGNSENYTAKIKIYGRECFALSGSVLRGILMWRYQKYLLRNLIDAN